MIHFGIMWGHFWGHFDIILVIVCVLFENLTFFCWKRSLFFVMQYDCALTFSATSWTQLVFFFVKMRLLLLSYFCLRSRGSGGASSSSKPPDPPPPEFAHSAEEEEAAELFGPADDEVEEIVDVDIEDEVVERNLRPESVDSKQFTVHLAKGDQSLPSSKALG